MAVHLLDVNVLVALAWENHAHHARARVWFAANAPAGWATCPLTQCGFVRISSNRRAIPNAVSPDLAVAALSRFVHQSHHTFWPDDLAVFDPTAIAHELIVGHQQVTDAYLLGLARHHGGRLATFDRAAYHLLRPGDHHLAVTIPA